MSSMLRTIRRQIVRRSEKRWIRRPAVSVAKARAKELKALRRRKARRAMAKASRKANR